MGRREFIALIGSSVIAHPLVAYSQVQTKPVIGYLAQGTRDGASARLKASSRVRMSLFRSKDEGKT